MNNKTNKIFFSFLVVAQLLLFVAWKKKIDKSIDFSSEQPSETQVPKRLEQERSFSKVTGKNININDLRGSLEKAISKKNPSNEDLSSFYDGIHQWAASNPEELLAWGGRIEAIQLRGEVLLAAVGALLEGSQVQKETAFNFVDKLDSGKIRDVIVSMNFERFFEIDEQKSLIMAESISDLDSLNILAKGLVDSEFGEDFVDVGMANLGYGALRNALGVAYAKKLTEEDPYSALIWIKEQQFDGLDESYYNVAVAFANQAPQDGLEAASQIKSSALRKKFIETLANKWGEENPREAGKWFMDEISTSGEFAFSEGMTDSIMGNWIQWNHDMPFSIVESADPFENRESLVLRMVKTLSEYNPSKAAERLNLDLDLPTAKKTKVVKQIMSNWMEKDSHSAANWANNLTISSERDTALNVLVNTVLKKDRDFETARLWLDEISDEKSRKKLLQKIEQMQNE